MADTRDVDEDVEVLVDGAWHYGILRQWRRVPDGWIGFVRYSTEPGKGYVDWFPADRIRQAQEMAEGNDD
jgi:hypothetical protein